MSWPDAFFGVGVVMAFALMMFAVAGGGCHG